MDEEEDVDFEERRPRGSRSITLAELPSGLFKQSTEAHPHVDYSSSFHSDKLKCDVLSAEKDQRGNVTAHRRTSKIRNKVRNELDGDHPNETDRRHFGHEGVFRKSLKKLRLLLSCLGPVINWLERLRKLIVKKLYWRKKNVDDDKVENLGHIVIIVNLDSYKNSIKPCLALAFGDKIQPFFGYRTVIPNHMLPHESVGKKNNPNFRYSGNKIKTTKYTLLTFPPKNMFEQFHRFANLYFVFIVFLNWFPQIEAFGKELSMVPVLFILAVTAIKDIYEDRRRYQSDQKINHSMCRVFSSKDDRYVRREWKNVLVGDIVHLSCNEIIPAYILLLNSSDCAGICFVETSNLDGESNLKQRQVIGTLQGAQAFYPTDFRSTIECEMPNNQIYKFSGFLLHSDGRREAISRNNLLLRGCEIRNTDFVEGIVVYAGCETKAMLNNSGPRYKRSKLERLMNKDIVWCVVILLILCFIGAVGNGLWLSSFDNLADVVAFFPYMQTQSNGKDLSPAYDAFIVFWSYIIILQVMIPISLYVSIEIVKLGQVFFITQDKQLCHMKKHIQCRALNIPEELGQIQYVMCDKTGTLTENHMIFRRCTVAGADYGSTEFNTSKEQIDYNSSVSSKETCKDVQPNRHLQKLLLKICYEMQEKSLSAAATVKKQAILDFFINMALCNTVVVNPVPHKDSMNSNGVMAPDIAQLLHNKRLARKGTWTGWNSGNVSIPTENSQPTRASNFALNMPKNVLRIESVGAQDFMQPAASKNCTESDLEPSDRIVHFETSNVSVQNASGSRGSDFRTQSVALRRMSQSVPLFNETDLGESGLIETQTADKLSLSGQADKLKHALQSEPDLLSRLELYERTEESTSHMTARYGLWFRTANFGKFWQDLPPLMAKLKLPPLTFMLRKAPSSDLSPTGYKNPFYEAESPDELALVYAAAAYGVRLVKRQIDHVTIETPDGRLLKYKLLHVLPFDSIRKRMSVVVKESKSNKILLFVKGADSALMDLISEEYCASEHGSVYYSKAIECTNFYASHGLRTLWLAKKELNPTQYAVWAELHAEAEMSLEDRDQLTFESAVRLERDLDLCGVTGIEDRLQEGVAECIDSLRRGGLKVWVLTGDKIETAVNIAYACKLFVYGMDLLQLSSRNEEDTLTVLQYHIDQLSYKSSQVAESSTTCSSTAYSNVSRLGLVIDGRTLAFCLSPACEDKFVQIIVRCTSILCCRATPLQKAAVVRLVKRRLGGMTLAIGDGANDVSMIQCADVGIGISGQEGMQAVMASDFAMARFCFLHRLLFVHGHWCYDRITRLVCYFFYKNALFVFASFWFQIWNGFSAQIMIDPLYLMLYNLVFTSLPPILMGVFDQDASDQVLLANPHLYSLGSNGLIVYDSNVDLWSFGFFITSCLVIVNQLHLASQIKSWTLPMAVSIIISINVFFAFALGYNAISLTCCAPDAPYHVAQNSIKTPIFWLGLLFVTVICLVPRFVFHIIKTTLEPSPVLLARVRWREKYSLPARSSFSIKKRALKWMTYFGRKNKVVGIELETIDRKTTDLPISPNNTASS